VAVKIGLNSCQLYSLEISCIDILVLSRPLKFLMDGRVQPSLGSSASKSQASMNHSHDSKKAVNAVLNDPSKSSQSRSMPSVGTGAGQIFSDIGLYKGVVIALKHIKKDHMQVSRQVLLEFNEVSVMSP